MIRAIQLLVQNNEGIIFVGVAGPSGAGKTVFTEKVLNFMPSVAVISMDNYNDASRIVDGNFDGKPDYFGWLLPLQFGDIHYVMALNCNHMFL
jgi:ABC-type dipeptide/oligopeptide/nickel transport system ATPase component